MSARKNPLPAAVAAVAAVAVALRVFALARMVEPPHVLHGDPEFYVKITQGLLERRWVPDVWIFPPGYPFVALPFAPFVGAGWSVILVSALAGIALPLLLLALARHVAHPERARWAALLVAVYPEAILSTARALSEAPALASIAATIIAFEASERAAAPRRRRLLAAAAGSAGGLCALTRPETAPLLPALAALAVSFPSHRPKRASRESAALFTAAALLVMAPYVLALHERSGVWGLSLKAHLNVQKTLVQEQGTTFVERRAIWDDYFEKNILRDGVIDPRRIAEGVDLKRHFLTRQFVPYYIEHLRYAFARRALLENALAVLGVAGLLAAAREGGRSRREAALAAISGLPFLAVPVLFPPIERYGLVALPAFAWGAGVVLAGGAARLRARAGARASAAASAAVGALLVIPASLSLDAESRNFHWEGRKYEFHVALSKGDLETAEMFVNEGLEVDPKNPGVRVALGDLRARRGDERGALAAYEDALRFGGGRVEVAYALGMMGKFAAAESVIAPLRSAPPNEATYWMLEGHLAAARGDARAAFAAYDRAQGLGAEPRTLAAAREEALRRAQGTPADSSAGKGTSREP